MCSQGFRPPQFSQDLAWLPTWFHHHHHAQVEAPADCETDPPAASNQAFKDLINASSNGKAVDILLSEEGRYNSCHLYLSGQDDSQNSVADPSPSPGNVLHLCLHLSSDGASQYSQSQLLYASQALHDSKKVLSLQQLETSAGPGEKAHQLKVDHNGVGVKFSPLTSIPIDVENFVPQSAFNKMDGSQSEEKMDCNTGQVHFSPLSSIPTTVENVSPLSPNNYKDSGQKSEEKCNIIHIKDADINDAVELSIAASEALVIHELLKTGSALEVLPTQAILEAALQVKQARLEVLKDDTGFPSGEIDEIDFLSDLDDSSMMDAFQDVGLSFSGFDNRQVCDSDISQVQETPALENHYGDNGSKNVQHLAPKDKVVDDSALGLNSSSVAYPVDPMLNKPAEKISNVSAVVQPQVDINSSAANISENAGEDKVHYSVADRFRSRWLGGWMVKEADASTKSQDNAKSILKCFVGETSFLSESADVAPDENSFVQRNETRSKIVSQSSIPFEGLCDKTDEGILISQEVRSSNLSLVDPLCSIVPCSISSENGSSLLAQNQNNGEVDAENCFSPRSEHGMENFERNSDLNVESVYVDSQAMPATGKCSGAPVRRQLASLKTYSTLLPKSDAIWEGRRHHHNRQFSSRCAVDPCLACIRSPDKRNSKGSLPFSAVFESSVGRDNEENQDVTIIRNSVAETSNQKKSHDQPAKEGAEVQIQASVQRRSPLILNRRARCRLQASEIVNNSTEEKNPEQAMAQETAVKFHQCKNLQKIQSNLKNPHITQNPVRKRVYFSEVEVELQQNKDLPKQHASYQTSRRNSSIFRATKKSKYSNPRSDSRSQNVKNCFKSHTKDVKRLIFCGVEFLLTGFSSKKEREIVGLIQKCGGMVLLDIPTPPSSSRAKRISRSNFQKLPIVICSKKLQTIKFLYGCAVNALILKVKWLTDSIAAGSVVPTEKYMVLSNQTDPKCTRIGKSVFHDDCKRIFDTVGIVLHGKHSFCTKLAAIIKHGGGQVFNTLQRLFQSLEDENVSMGAVVAEDESRALRHLKLCASERKIPMMPASWIAKSLHLGRLLPFKEKEDTPLTIKVAEFAPSVDWSEEI